MDENKLKETLDNPQEMERLYRSDKKAFETLFNNILPEINDEKLIAFWKARLDYEKTGFKTAKILKSDIIALTTICLITWLLIKLPGIFNFNLSDELFYERNAGIIFFFGLSFFTVLKAGIKDSGKLIFALLSFLIPAVYINLMPINPGSQSVTLAYIHLPLLMWCIYALIFTGFDIRSMPKRMEYIKYNGDLAVLGAIILIAGGALMAVTIGLFSVIDIRIEKFYVDNIAIWGVMAAPVVATFIILNYPFVADRIAPIIAAIFSPIVLLTLIIYLITIPISGKDPYNDRDFLLVFNLMLLGVMGIIAFSVSESTSEKWNKFNKLILFLLSVVTLLINIIALSAIFYRLGEFGVSPNRIAVIGSNLLVFINLIFITVDLFNANFRNGELKKVELTISSYLPVYALWTLLVVFTFPLLFGFK